MEIPDQIPNIQSLTFEVLMKLIDEHSIFAITDEKGVITHANSEFLKLSQYSREELIGSSHNILRSDEHSDEFFTNLWHTISSGETWKGEIKNKAKDGSHYWLKTTIRAMYNPKNEIIAYVSLRTDITDHKKNEQQAVEDKEEIKKQNEKLKEKDELLQTKNLKLETELLGQQKELLKNERLTSIGLLASRMSHDMRNPLSIIRVSMENIKMLNELNFKNIHQFEKIERATQRMTHQIDNVLDYVKDQYPRKYKIEFSKILTDAIDLTNIPRKVDLIRPKKDYEIVGDKRLFSTAMINLIYNAIQAINGIGTIEITINEIESITVIQIKDSGKGIPKENIEKIFDPLFTTKQSGTGLGLSSVKSIIEAHGGNILVTSPPTIFTITIPKNQD